MQAPSQNSGCRITVQNLTPIAPNAVSVSGYIQYTPLKKMIPVCGNQKRSSEWAMWRFRRP